MDKKGFGIVMKREDPYEFYSGRYVEVTTQNMAYWGMYRGINENGDIVLRPSIRRESHPTDKNKEESANIFALIDEPQFINHNAMISLGPIREEYMLSVIERRQIIFPSMKN